MRADGGERHPASLRPSFQAVARSTRLAKGGSRAPDEPLSLHRRRVPVVFPAQDALRLVTQSLRLGELLDTRIALGGMSAGAGGVVFGIKNGIHVVGVAGMPFAETGRLD